MKSNDWYFNPVLLQHRPAMTAAEVREFLMDREGVCRVNFWPKQTVTVWMKWTPRPTRDQVKSVRDLMDNFIPVGIERRIMAVPGKYGPPIWHKYIPLAEQVQRDIELMVFLGQY